MFLARLFRWGYGGCMGLGASSLPRSCKEDVLGRAQMEQTLYLSSACTGFGDGQALV